MAMRKFLWDWRMVILYDIIGNMSIDGDCPYCGGHSTDAEWDAWNGECQWCGKIDVEWEKKEDKDEIEDDDELDDDYE